MNSQRNVAVVTDAVPNHLEESTVPGLVLGTAAFAMPAPIRRKRVVAQSVPTLGEDGRAARVVAVACHANVIDDEESDVPFIYGRGNEHGLAVGDHGTPASSHRHGTRLDATTK